MCQLVAELDAIWKRFHLAAPSEAEVLQLRAVLKYLHQIFSFTKGAAKPEVPELPTAPKPRQRCQIGAAQVHETVVAVNCIWEAVQAGAAVNVEAPEAATASTVTSSTSHAIWQRF